MTKKTKIGKEWFEGLKAGEEEIKKNGIVSAVKMAQKADRDAGFGVSSPLYAGMISAVAHYHNELGYKGLSDED